MNVNVTIRNDTPGERPSSYSVMLDRAMVIARFDHDEQEGLSACLRKAAESVEKTNAMKVSMAAIATGVLG